MRSRLRIRLTEPISAVFAWSDDGEGRGLIRDVSHGGLFVRSAELLPPGTPVAAAVTTPAGCRAVLEGEVCWNTAHVRSRLEPGFGLRLTKKSDEYTGFVEGAIAAARFAHP